MWGRWGDNGGTIAPRASREQTAPLGAAPSNCRLYLAGQYQWEQKLGFYLDFEGSRLRDLPLILGVADGRDWRFTSHAPGFEAGRPYRIRAARIVSGPGTFTSNPTIR